MAVSVGDRVTAVMDYDRGKGPIYKGDEGIVVYAADGDDQLGIAWDREDRSMHNLSGLCENHHGWWVSRHFVSVLQQEPLCESAFDIETLFA